MSDTGGITFLIGVFSGFLLFVLFVACVAKEEKRSESIDDVFESEDESNFQDAMIEQLIGQGRIRRRTH
jgi:hypothetical protein